MDNEVYRWCIVNYKSWNKGIETETLDDEITRL